MTGYEPGTPVWVRYPVTMAGERGDRELWPWLAGTVTGACGPDEWQVQVDAPQVAQTEDGEVPPAGTPDEDLWHPLCFRDGSELRRRSW